MGNDRLYAIFPILYSLSKQKKCFIVDMGC